MKNSKILLTLAIVLGFTISAQAYSGQELAQDITGAIGAAWDFWKNHFWVGG